MPQLNPSVLFAFTMAFVFATIPSLGADYMVISGETLNFMGPSGDYLYFWTANLEDTLFAQSDNREFVFMAPQVSSEEGNIINVSMLIKSIEGGCTNETTAEVHVYPLPICGISGPDSTGPSDVATYTYSGGSTGNLSYIWTIDGVEIPGANDNAVTVNWADYSPGVHQIGLLLTKTYDGIVPGTTSPSRTINCSQSVAAVSQTVTPLLECVANNHDGTYTAHFGYMNRGDQSATMPIGDTNSFSPDPADRGQPTVFDAGTFSHVFSIDFDGDPISWTLGRVSVTASKSSNPCSFSISGVVYSDKDNDGNMEENETGLSGWTVELISNGVVISTAITGTDGSYAFRDLPPGNYEVRELPLPGWVQTSPETDTISILLSDQDVDDADFGNFKGALGGFSVYGMKFADYNSNGVKDPDEVGLGGWTIDLVQDDIVIQSSTTLDDGSYHLSYIESGDYVIREEQQGNWTATTPAGGSVSTNIDQSLSDMDFGNYPKPDIVLEKNCTASTPYVRIGDVVTYTYDVTNTGNGPLVDVTLTDTQEWGPSCDPVYVSGDDGNGILDPGETWHYECVYTIPDPSDYPESAKLTTMADTDASKMIVLTKRMLEMRTRLEIKLNNLREQRQRFDAGRATLSMSTRTIEGQKYNVYNYTNTASDEILTKISDDEGTVRRTEYIDPVTNAILITRYDVDGKITSETYRSMRTDEQIQIEYDTPYYGYKTYTVTDFETGDTMVLIVDSYGNTISMEFRKTPGYKVYEAKTLAVNVALVTAEDKSGVSVSDLDTFRLEIRQPLPYLEINKTANPDPVTVGTYLNYTLNFENQGEDAHQVVVKETYDSNVTFISAEPVPDAGTTDTWSIGDLLKGQSGKIEIVTKVKDTASTSVPIRNRANITCQENVWDLTDINTTTRSKGIYINKTGPEVIVPDELMTYDITYTNNGPDVAEDVNITDVLDLGVTFDSFESTRDPLDYGDDGGHTYWWYFGDLDAGEGGTIRLIVKVKDASYFEKDPEYYKKNTSSIFNDYKLNYNTSLWTNGTLGTLVVHGLWINKTADKAIYKRGENITYTIKYGNAGDVKFEGVALAATDVNVTDLLPDVDYLGTSAGLNDSTENNILKWGPFKLEPHEMHTIKIYVHIPEKPIIKFNETSSVVGDGYIFVNKRLSTVDNENSLTNKANISGNFSYIDEDDNVINKTEISNATCSVHLGGSIGSTIETTEHGSGHYDQEERTTLQTANKTIRLDKNIFSNYERTTFSLPQERTIDFDSKWADRTTAKNYDRGDTVTENYRYQDTLEKNSSFLTDGNQTVYKSEAEFIGGKADIGYMMGPWNSTEVELRDDYHGSFRVMESVDSYGSTTIYEKSSQGQGFVASDKRNLKQRSLETGSGYYRSEENFQDGYVEKDSTMTYAPSNQTANGQNVNYSSAWHEGLSTKDPSNQLAIIEEIRHADYIDKQSLVEDRSMSLLGKFDGDMELKAVKGDPEQIVVEQKLTGEYDMDTAVSIYKIPKHLRPHINLTEDAYMEDEETAVFVINVTNDGTEMFKPVVISNLLQEGSTFYNASRRPDEINGSWVNWTLPTLQIGRIQIIKLRVKIDENVTGIRNVVYANATYDEGIFTTETNYTRGFNWLTTSPVSPYYGLTLNKTKIGYYGEWEPATCMNCTSEAPCCEEDIDEYYDRVDAEDSDCICV